MEKKNYLKPEIGFNEIKINPFMISSVITDGTDSAEDIKFKDIDNHYILRLNGIEDVDDATLWNYLASSNSISLCADKEGTATVGSQTFYINKCYTYTVKNSHIGADGTYYFDVVGTGETCTEGSCGSGGDFWQP